MLPEATISLASFWMPQRASSVAADSDWLFFVILWVSVFFFSLITILMLVFVVKYRHREGEPDRETTAGHSTALELTWTIIPTIIVMVIYWYGFRGYVNMSVEPQNSYQIAATGQMWKWDFTYPNGAHSEVLYVPLNVPVAVALGSQDVIHSLSIPAFRIKKDAVPGRYNRAWFEATELGTFDVYCAMYCGSQHSTMRAKCIVLPQNEFEKKVAELADWTGRLSPIQAGKHIYEARGCAACHSDKAGVVITGPSWRDLYGSRVAIDPDGHTVLADDAYIRESIQFPSAKIVHGFPNVMPTIPVSDRDVGAIIWYMRSISANFKGDLTLGNSIAVIRPPTTTPATGASTEPSTPPTVPPSSRPAVKIAEPGAK